MNAERQAANTTDATARRSFRLLAEGWTGLADDIEHRLNGQSKRS